ncbi:MAG: DUF3618 domain-containing protein [bacterium]|jgi:hypothetical protein
MIERSHYPYNPEGSSDEIRSSINQTRDNMDQTLDELGEKLHPKNLLDDCVGLFTSFTGTSSGQSTTSNQEIIQYASSIGKTLFHHIKNNPGPALMIATGIAWLIWNEMDEENDPQERRHGVPYPYDQSIVDARTGRPYDDPLYPELDTPYGSPASYEDPYEEPLADYPEEPISSEGYPYEPSRSSSSHIITSTTETSPSHVEVPQSYEKDLSTHEHDTMEDPSLKSGTIGGSTNMTRRSDKQSGD